jgi:hypothetical protein
MDIVAGTCFRRPEITGQGDAGGGCARNGFSHIVHDSAIT